MDGSMVVTVVGGGVLGTMHAWCALDRGHRVVQIERDHEARSASVRNLGLVWVSGRRAGDELALAWRARELWADVGARVPDLGFRPAGSLTVALDDRELAVMAAFAASDAAAARDTVLIDPTEARAVAPAVAGDIAGALHCRADAVVEPRTAQRALRAAMASTGRYRFVGGRHVVGRSGTVAIDHTGERHGGDVLIVCPGAVHDGLLGEHLHCAPLQRCQLQMLETDPLDAALGVALADADSLRYYPAYDAVDLAGLGPQTPPAAAHRAQLLLVQRLDGSLTVGDTHRYDPDPDPERRPAGSPSEPLPFDVDEDAYEHLLGRATAILGRRLPRVRRRWSGVYSQLSPGVPGVYHHVEVEPGVVVVTGPGGRGMTLAPAIAERTWESLP